MEDDNISVRTPTQTEIATFQVMANLDYVDLKKPKPTSENIAPRIEEEMDEDIYPDEAAEDHDSPKILPPVLEEQVEILGEENTPVQTPVSRKSSVKTPVNYHEKESSSSGTFMNQIPNPESNPLYAKAKRMTELEIITEKEGLLLELQMMEKQGIIKLSREFTMSDSLEEIQFQVDRANTNYAASNAVELAKTGIRVGSKGIEIIARRMGTNALDGFSNNLCKDMNKFTRPLTKLYRKYWRRGGITSPETELAMIVLGSIALTVVQNKDFGGIGNMVAGALGSNIAKPKEPVKEAPKFDMSKVASMASVGSMGSMASMVNNFPSVGSMGPMPPMPTVIPTSSISSEPKKITLRPPVIPSASWDTESVTKNSVQTAQTAQTAQTVPTLSASSAPTKTITIGTPSSSIKRNRKAHNEESSMVL